MKRKKACKNQECSEFKVKVDEKKKYCYECGEKLSFICKDKKCYTFLEPSDDEYCPSCKEKKNKKDEAVVDGVMDGVKKIGPAATLGAAKFVVDKKILPAKVQKPAEIVLKKVEKAIKK